MGELGVEGVEGSSAPRHAPTWRGSCPSYASPATRPGRRARPTARCCFTRCCAPRGRRRRRPLVVVVEDLHWADASSRELLGFLVGRLRGSVLLVATYRSDELHRRHPLRPLLAEAARDERVVRLELGPLRPAEVAEQLEAIAGSAHRRRSWRRSSSAPRATRSSPRSCWRPGAGPSCRRGWRTSSAARLAALPRPPTSWCGSRRSPGGAPGTTCSRPSRARAPTSCRRPSRGDVSPRARRRPRRAYAFRHALLQEAAYAELLPGERVALHGAYAAALAAHPEWAATPSGAAGELAHHYAAARDPPRALRPRWRRPARPDTYALGEAHALYEQALALWDQVPAPSEPAGCERSCSCWSAAPRPRC